MPLPAGAYQPFEVSYIDAGGETGRMQGYAKLISAANFDAQESLWAALLAAVDAVTLGARQKDRYNDESIYSVARPTNGAARELKLLVQMVDDVTGQRFNFTIPTLDPTIPSYVQNISARDAVVTTTPSTITDLITAVEAFVVNPRAPGNAVTVIGLKVVGRNV